MKNLKLESLSLFSLLEGTAWRVDFHPKTTLIVGANDTGKSSVLKSIYATFGASVELHPKWKEAHVGSLIHFSIDNAKYAILRHGDKFATFDGNGSPLGHFSKITSQLGPHLASLFEFKLSLRDKKDVDHILPPSYLFMPFYLDQDKGWQSSWNSFGQLMQFRDWKGSLIHYHTGIRPQAFYDTKAQLSDLGLEFSELKAKRDALSDIRLRIVGEVNVLFDYNIESFSKEISELLVLCNSIREMQQDIKSDLEDLYGRKSVLLSQIGIAERAIKENNRDFDYATIQLATEEISCPTCGNHYANGFAERFAIALDEDDYLDLSLELKGELNEVEMEISKKIEKYTKQQLKEAEIVRLLETKKGDVQLSDLIENEGRKKGENTILSNIDAVDAQINSRLVIENELKAKLKTFESKKRKDEIVGFYSERMRGLVDLLDVKNLPETNLKRLDAPIKDQGSDAPRAMLAYFYSILHVIGKYSSSTFCPIVIDSPQQQDQDKMNFQKVLEVIRDERPPGSQLILGMTDAAGVDFGDAEIVNLQNKWHLLQPSMFESTMEIVRAYLRLL